MPLAASSNTCCSPCDEPLTTAVPGPAGAAGAAGDAGTNGVDAFTTANSFVMPANEANVTVTMVSSAWMGIGQVVFAVGGGFSGYFEVISKADTTHAVLKNLETATAYTSNSAPGSVFPALTMITAGGLQGVAGSSPAGAALIVNQLGDVGFTPATMRTNLQLGSSALLDDADVFQVVNDLNEGDPATMRTSLALGTMATQAAGAVAITGGTLNGTLGGATPAAAAVTTLASTGTHTESGRIVQTPSALQTLTAASTISANAAKVRVAGTAGATTLTTTPSISAGVADGQRLLIKGTDATNTVVLQDTASLAGTTLELGAATRALGLNSQIELSYDSTSGKWVEISFSANT